MPGERGEERAGTVGRGRIRAPRSFTAGASLVALAVVALAASSRLDAGTLRAMGPGMLPRVIAALVLVAGVAIVGLSLLRAGEPLGRWPLRGPLFVCLAIVSFALTIRTVGLAVAGPLVVFVSGFASPDVRPRELAIFAVLVTAFCVGLFRYALGLPIPVLVLPGLRL